MAREISICKSSSRERSKGPKGTKIDSYYLKVEINPTI
ncbi:uncharacterized protein FFB14_09439 [Fusarium fujikuroi]|nr:uncharacterized protein FFB14_09439 [Fusarium fujikuroi]